ncbi:MAG: HAD family hydrolase [Calditrichaeota bacterium]|nr:MAG: HAD family hydrolase [Calditrichota bacterium]
MKTVREEILCHHCGEPCRNTKISVDGKYFCCHGCRLVYEMLQKNHLEAYYQLAPFPGKAPANREATDFQFLDNPEIRTKLLEFADDGICTATFQIPQIHCSSCIYLLEHLYKVHEGIARTRVNFLRKELFVVFDERKISLRELVQLLASMGYEPHLNLSHLEKPEKRVANKGLLIKLGVAGFAFGNIMLLSLPEYLSLQSFLKSEFRPFFGYLSLLLALPVLLYSSQEYFASAWSGLRHKIINIDVPVSLGILVLFFRSMVEILWLNGAGYLDSFSGLVFFLLLGKVFQKKTYDALSFERDFKSYFPIAVTKITPEGEKAVALSELQKGDRILVRHRELVPADSRLLSAGASIDYSFVTGESRPVAKKQGEMIYAGGRQMGPAIELQVLKSVSKSYLTRIWHHDIFQQQKTGRLRNLTDKVAQYFTFIVLTIAFFTAIYWLPRDWSLAVNGLTAVLIVACPCALALSIPFALGNALRILGKQNFFLKNTDTIENMARVDTLVLDKTGTLTYQGSTPVKFMALNGYRLSQEDRQRVKSLVRHSAHPLSQQIYLALEGSEVLPVDQFREQEGRGIEGKVAGKKLRLGSRAWVGVKSRQADAPATQDGYASATVYMAIDGRPTGYFALESRFRDALQQTLHQLGKKYELVVLSGDQPFEREQLQKQFGKNVEMHFNQSPADKLEFVKKLQARGKRVMMIGDGLNDAGALKQSDVGVAISEDLATFSPACDAILQARQFPLMHRFLEYARASIGVVFVSFAISFLYNAVGLGFAVTGRLSPLIAAVLMPLSSITVVAFTTAATRFRARRMGLL